MSTAESISEVGWGQLKAKRPDLADAGREMLYQYGLGLAFLATVRSDGGPRLHPISPMLTEEGLYAFIVPSPKCDDLLRDGRFALHSYAKDNNEDAFYITGSAVSVSDTLLRQKLEEQYRSERPALNLEALEISSQDLFELQIDTVLVTRTDAHGDPNPRHTIWHAALS
ncbi:pyridoxamine 5'-phosphate oxidase [Candidatus Microgenomates bacterium]|nr:pyridoxamine 5'-phosphate oxidase [Candidatus Microgenomates bacterium]